jgi:hypothetical protein
MKTCKPIVLDKGNVMPVGTELDFVDSKADWNGNTVNLNQLPYAACEYEMNKELNPAIWTDNELHDDVKKQLLSIAQDFYNDSGFKAPIVDIVLTGSMANYNYHDDSDLDVHIIIDYSKENADTDLVRIAANAIKWKWNEQHNIKIAGHDVELYIQDENEPHTASGVYSLMQGKWLVVPTVKTISTSETDVAAKVQSIVDQTSALQQQVDNAGPDTDFDALLDSIDAVRYAALHLRKDAFAEGEDEFSVGNLAFKELRNNGTIEKLLNMETQLYDKMHSIDATEDDDDSKGVSELCRAIINLSKRGLTAEQIKDAMNMTTEQISSIIAQDAEESDADRMYQQFFDKVNELLHKNKTTAEIADALHIPVMIVDEIVNTVNKYH